MEEIKNYQKKIKKLLTMLDEENLTAIDFDELKLFLDEINTNIPNFIATKKELEIMRDDYICRMSGMLKAIAAVQRNRDENQQIVDLVESFSTLSAAQLVAYYPKISAKFRDSFPTSFGYLTKCNKTGEKISLSDFK